MSQEVTPVVSMRHITMQFPGVLANDDVSLDIRKGEIFALVGENGAGKSTLMNILYGMYTPTDGEVLVRGERLFRFDPNEAIRHGIGMVHQHFMLVPSFTVAQNIVLNTEPRRGLFYDFRRANQIVEELVQEYGLAVRPTDTVRDISVGLQQRVEILKALYRGADILILDEPTAVLTPQETDELFDVIRSIVRIRQMTVIIITHKLNEVMAISDRVGVMRQGKLIGVCQTCDVNERILASMMVGKDVLMEPFIREKTKATEPALVVENLSVLDNRGLPAVRGLSLKVFPGEILGIAGIEGNGQSELAEAVTGMRHVQSGQIRILNRDVTGMDPAQIRALGVSHVPEDRIQTGLSGKSDIVDNLVVGREKEPQFSIRGFHLKKKRMKEYAEELSANFDIRGGGIHTPTQSLSGGNMQKVLVAREFSSGSRVMIISQPSRGVDVGAMDFIHRQIMEKRSEGCAILLISADLDELYRLSDRLCTVYEGSITGEFDPSVTEKREVGLYMTGRGEEAGHE